MKKELCTLGNVMRVLQESFDLTEYRLCGHGGRVAYMVWKMLKEAGNHSDKDLIKIIILAFFHDIGAYKTEEIDDLIEFEVNYPHRHAIYGYLFLKYLSPAGQFSEIILYHHLNIDDFQYVSTKYKEEALLFHFLDRIDILSRNNIEITYESLKSLTSNIASDNKIKTFIKLNDRDDIYNKVKNNTYREEFYEYLESFELNNQERVDLVKMLVFIIDFRSPNTVTHSVVIATITKLICDIYGFKDIKNKKVVLAAFLHDVGKLTTPIEILEKTGKLTSEEMEIMKKHVLVSKRIIEGLGLSEVAKIAASHHEKLDGSGYPHGLDKVELSFEEKIIAVADIFSALIAQRSYKEVFCKEKVCDILNGLVLDNKIDGEITSIIIENYDFFIDEANKIAEKYLKVYEFFNKRFLELSNEKVFKE